jgi:hypothetical protein
VVHYFARDSLLYTNTRFIALRVMLLESIPVLGLCLYEPACVRQCQDGPLTRTVWLSAECLEWVGCLRSV